MQKIYPGQEVVSLFNPNFQPKQLTQNNSGALTKIIAVVSAFLVVVAVALIFNSVSQNLELKAKTAAAAGSEKVAFQPSQVISQEITQGYFGK